MLFPTTLVGSYPQPEWLIDRKKLAGRFPPRVRARELWRIPDAHLAEAQDDATLLAIRAQEEAGLDIVTDGEIRRESYSNRFATALEGVDIDNPGTALDRSGHPNPVPRIVGKIRRKHAVEIEDLQFLRLLLSRRACGLHLPPGFNRDCAVQSRLLGARVPARQNDHPRRDRLERRDGGDAGKGRRAHPPRPALRRARAHRRRARLRDEVLAARGGVRENESDGRGREAHARRARPEPIARTTTCLQ